MPPAKHGRKARQPKPPERHSRMDALAPQEAERLVRAAVTPRDRFYLRLLVNFGLRAAEVGHVCIEWMDGQRHLLKIPRQCVCGRCRETGKPWRSKTDDGARTIPIGKHVETLVSSKTFFEYYADPARQQVSRQRVWQIVKKCANKAAFLDRRVYPHALRATAASQFAEMGANEAQVCRLLGWSDLRSARPYIKASVIHVENFLEGKDLQWW